MGKMEQSLPILEPGNLLEVLKYPHPFLSKICVTVSEVNDDIRLLIKNMFVTMYSSNGVGLSANQVGSIHRVFVMDTSESGSRRRAFVNPCILSQSQEVRWKEGCLSFPGVFAFVKRFEKIKVAGLDENGELYTIELEGLDAICFQHELDHLSGITFYDHLSQLQKNMIRKKMSKIK